MVDMKLIVGLGLGLLLSIGGNLWLGHKVLTGKLECAHAAKLAREEGRSAALQGRADLLSDQVGLVVADRNELLQNLSDIHDNERATIARLRGLLGKIPTPTCAPGSARIEAWNSIGRGDP